MTIESSSRSSNPEEFIPVTAGEEFLAFNIHARDGLNLLDIEHVMLSEQVQDRLVYARAKRVVPLTAFKDVDLKVAIQTLLFSIEYQNIDPDQIEARPEIGEVLNRRFRKSL